MNGWVKFHRKLLDNPVVCKDADHIAIWLYLLLNASHNVHSQLYGGKTVELRPGQLITGRRVIGEKLKIEETKVKRVLKAFQLNGQISIQGEKGGSLISVLNWEEYQGDEKNAQINAQQNAQINAQIEKAEKPYEIRDCAMLSKKNAQINAQQNAQINAHNQEVIKNNNKKKTTPKGVAKEKRVFFCDSVLNAAFLDYIEFRKQIRSPMTERAITLAINKLNTLSRDPDEQCRILEQSIMNGWKGLFPLRNDGGSQKNKFSAIDDFLKGDA